MSYGIFLVTSTWSVEDKLTLLQSLHKHGTGDLMKLGEDLPFKSVTEIRNLIQVYEKLAMKEVKGDMYEKDQVFPINEWVTFLRQHTVVYSNMMALHRALKYIAMFENRTEVNINLTECYEYISDLSNKAAPKDISQRSGEFLRLCLADLAKKVKNKDNNAELEFVKKISRKDLEPCISYSRKAVKRSAVVDNDLNPLKIPKTLLNQRESDKK